MMCAARTRGAAQDDMPVILAWAGESLCRPAAARITRGEHAAAHGQIKTLSTQPLPWRQQVTNGLQQGFFIHTLLGWCLARNNDYAKAYRAWQYAGTFMPPLAALTGNVAAAEWCAVLGRASLRLGREQEAARWLNAARAICPRHEAASEELAALAIANGDYVRAYGILGELCAQVLTPSRRAYALLADTLFYLGADHDAFDALIVGIEWHGIDTELVHNDPLITLFKQRLGRASQDEICIFYDALGRLLDRLEPVSPNEAALAYAANERTLLTRVFPFLTKEDDLARLRANIAALETARRRDPPVWRAPGQAVTNGPPPEAVPPEELP